jgi:hypothetical protein
MTVVLPLQAFTLSWTHSIEKIRWDEDYQIVGHKMEIVDARIRGSGAGMDPPDGAVLKNGVWHYKPAIGALPTMELARSPYVADYTICWDNKCHPMAEVVGSVKRSPVVDVSVCDRSPTKLGG